MTYLKTQAQNILLGLICWVFLVGAAYADMPRKVNDTLSVRDAELYAQIFDLQSASEFSKANDKIKKLQNALLMGHVLAQRYLHAQSRKATYQELKDWLLMYADHPQADRIYKLAISRGEEKELRKPEALKPLSPLSDAIYESGKKYQTKKKRTPAEADKVKNLEYRVRNLVREYSTENARTLLKKDPAVLLLDMVEIDHLKSLIAAGYLYSGNPKSAAEYASAPLMRSGKYVPMAGWVSGIANWQLKKYQESAKAFEIAATSPYASAWTLSGASFWASRAHLRTGKVKQVSRWLKIAAEHPYTFYGQIAIRALGQNPVFHWEIPALTPAMERKIMKRDAGIRARALIKSKQGSMAEMELSRLAQTKDKGLQSALLSYAQANNLPGLSYRLGFALSKKSGKKLDAALYPMMPWLNEAQYDLDQALVHAFARQESQFNTLAENPSGATGLMQILPSTAAAMAKKKSLSADLPLIHPVYNLTLGQAYLQHLMKDPSVNRDLMSLAIAYNAGPGKLAKWKAERPQMKDDVLLFIETIPYGETRAFVERVLVNFWIYRMRLGYPTPTLDAVAEGRWAEYDPIQDPAQMLFSSP